MNTDTACSSSAAAAAGEWLPANLLTHLLLKAGAQKRCIRSRVVGAVVCRSNSYSQDMKRFLNPECLLVLTSVQSISKAQQSVQPISGGVTQRLCCLVLKRSEYQHDICHVFQWPTALSLRQSSRGPAILDLCTIDAWRCKAHSFSKHCKYTAEQACHAIWSPADPATACCSMPGKRCNDFVITADDRHSSTQAQKADHHEAC